MMHGAMSRSFPKISHLLYWAPDIQKAACLQRAHYKGGLHSWQRISHHGSPIPSNLLRAPTFAPSSAPPLTTSTLKCNFLRLCFGAQGSRDRKEIFAPSGLGGKKQFHSSEDRFQTSLSGNWKPCVSTKIVYSMF